MKKVASSISLISLLVGWTYQSLIPCSTDKHCLAEANEYYRCIEGNCWRKPIDFSAKETVGVVIIVGLVGITNSGGVGAGSAIVPVLITFLNYLIANAIPQGRIVVLTGSIITFIMMGFSRHPKEHNHFLTDYRLAAVITPLLVAGSQVGVFLARWLPPFLLSTLMVVYVAYSIMKTYKRAQKENEKHAKAKETKEVIENTKSDDIEDLEEVEIDALEEQLDSETKALTTEPGSNQIQEELMYKVEPQPKPLMNLLGKQMFNFGIITSSILIVTLAALLVGGPGTQSLVKFERCKLESNCILVTSHLLLVLLAYLAYKHNDDHFQPDYEHDEESVKKSSARKKLVFGMYLGGILSGFLGVGGGMILGLFMLELGMDVYSSTALSNFTVFLSSTSTSLQFISAGLLRWENSMILMGAALIGSFLGNILFRRLVHKSGNPAIIVWILFWVLWLALISLTVEAFINLTTKGKGALSFGSIC